MTARGKALTFGVSQVKIIYAPTMSVKQVADIPEIPRKLPCMALSDIKDLQGKQLISIESAAVTRVGQPVEVGCPGGKRRVSNSIIAFEKLSIEFSAWERQADKMAGTTTSDVIRIDAALATRDDSGASVKLMSVDATTIEHVTEDIKKKGAREHFF